MLKLLLKKLLQGIAMIIVVSAVTFSLLGLAGGDALSELRDNPQISEETIERLRTVYGLDQPLPARYFQWLTKAVIGDLGDSTYFRLPVIDLILARGVNTFTLGIAALAIAVIIAFVLAVANARYKTRVLSILVDFIVLATASSPRIVLALLALAISARVAVDSTSPFLFWLAAAALAAPLISIFLAHLNNELESTMQEDFIKLARAKGLTESVVVLRHAIRAALNPVLTIFGISLGGVLGGSVVVESVLGRQGLGTLMVSAVRGRDLPLVMGIVLFTSVAVWLGNTLAEALQAVNDKRMRDTRL